MIIIQSLFWGTELLSFPLNWAASKVVKRISDWLPDTWVLENVKSLVNKKHKKFFKRMLAKPLSIKNK